MTISPQVRRALLLLGWLALVGITFFHGLGSFGLMGKDEPRYAAIAAAMVARHDFITPTLWGHAWLEKPVLYYWLAAGADWIRGASDGAARFPNALLAALLSASLWWFLRRVHSARAGVLAAYLSATATWMVAFGRAASTDMTLAAPLCWAVMSVYLGLRLTVDGLRFNATPARNPWFYAAAGFAGLAVLAKGPVGLILPGLILAVWWTVWGLWKSVRVRELMGPVVLFLVIAAPWYVLVSLRNPEFPRVFFLQHNLQRFATNRYDHPQPFWFYLPILLAALFPWTAGLALPCLQVWKRATRRLTELESYLAIWLAVPIVFFSLSQSKLPSYILPAVPAALAGIAVAAAEMWEALPRWPLALCGTCAALLPAALQVLPEVLAGGKVGAAIRNPLALELAAAGAAVMCILALRRRQALVLGASCLLVAGAVLAATRPPLAWEIDASQSVRPEVFTLLKLSDVPVAAYHLDPAVRYGLEYYLHREVPDWTPEPQPTLVFLDNSAGSSLIRACTGCGTVRLLPGERAAHWMAVVIEPRR